MKKIELFFISLLLPLDFVMIFLAGISAYHARFSSLSTDIRPVIFNLPFLNYLIIVLIIDVTWIIVFVFSGLYNTKAIQRFRDEFRKILLACSFGFTLILVTLFSTRGFFSSRFIVLAGWIFSIIFISLARLVVRGFQRLFYIKGIGTKKIVVVGDSQTTNNLIYEFSTKKSLGYEVVKRLSNFDLDSLRELEEFIKIKKIDEVIQSDPNLSKAEVLRLYDFADQNHITFKYAADFLDVKVLRVDVNEIAGVPIVEVKKTSLDGWGRILKRLCDIVGSSILIILTSPIMLIMAIAIKLDSRGPVFFSKLDDGSPLCRVGQAGKKFRYLKFRSMIPNSDSMRYNELADKNIRGDGPMVKIKDDPRVTRVGKFIRRFSLDELSEFFLVFIGSMSLVGPRPHLPEEVAKYSGYHKKVLTIKPGITGMAQVSGRSDLSFEEEVKLDTYYIENWSLLLDLSIFFKTPLAVLKPRKAE